LGLGIRQITITINTIPGVDFWNYHLSVTLFKKAIVRLNDDVWMIFLLDDQIQREIQILQNFVESANTFARVVVVIGVIICLQSLKNCCSVKSNLFVFCSNIFYYWIVSKIMHFLNIRLMEFCYWHLKTFSSFSKRNKIENFSTFGSQNKIENLLEIVEAECVELVTLKCIFQRFFFLLN